MLAKQQQTKKTTHINKPTERCDEMKKEIEGYSLHQLEGGKRAGRPQHDASDLSVVLQTAEQRSETPMHS